MRKSRKSKEAANAAPKYYAARDDFKAALMAEQSNPESIRKLTAGFDELPLSEASKINRGDYVRWLGTDGYFRKGGYVQHVVNSADKEPGLIVGAAPGLTHRIYYKHVKILWHKIDENLKDLTDKVAAQDIIIDMMSTFLLEQFKDEYENWMHKSFKKRGEAASKKRNSSRTSKRSSDSDTASVTSTISAHSNRSTKSNKSTKSVDSLDSVNSAASKASSGIFKISGRKR